MPLSPAQQQNAQLLYGLAVSRGLPPARAREFVAAAYSESGLNPQATNAKSGAAGFYQLLSGGYRQRAQALGGLYNPRANALAILPDYQSYWRQHPNAQPGEAGRDVERSGMGSQFYSRPLSLLGAFGGGQAAPAPRPVGAPVPPLSPAAPPAPGQDPRRALAAALLRSSQSGDYGGFFQTLQNVRQRAIAQPVAQAVGSGKIFGTQGKISGTPQTAPVSEPSVGAPPSFVHPTPGGKFLRVDQGVDFSSPRPVVSIGSGVVTKVSPRGSWAGGTGQAVYVHLDRPIVVHGRTYHDVYYAEESPLVKAGQRVKAGQPVMAAGGNELGFARGGGPLAPLVGGLGAGTRQTTPGQDFLSFLRSTRTR